jgi:hypothetical protein
MMLQTLSEKELRQARKRCNDAIGRLSNPSKLPKKTRRQRNISTGSSYSTSAYDCHVGGILREVPGSVCEDCYACKGRQNFPANQAAYRKRSALYQELGADKWRDNLCIAIEDESDFRFFDSGDLADYAQLVAIVQLAALRPDVRFWLPTKEYALVARLYRERIEVPSNLCIRVSAPMRNKTISGHSNVSVVFDNAADVPADAHICACSRGIRHTCDDPNTGESCRNCWDRNIAMICYLRH